MDDKADLNRYELKEGDVIRIGRLFLRLKLLKLQKYEKKNNYLNNSINGYINNINITTTNENNNNITINTELNLQEIHVNSQIYRKRTKVKFSNFKQQNNAQTKEEKKEVICRICYSDENNEENPLVQPCNCHGSLKYIHLNCLKQWLKTNTYKLQEHNEYLKIFKVKKAECELCKTELPDFIRHKGKLYEIIDFGEEFNNYALFENLIDDKHNDKYLYMISLDNNNTLFRIGRGNSCNIILNDASISRNHCALRLFNKKLFLEDCNSKFGTLILIYPHFLNLIEGVKLYLQIGRSFLKCQVQNSISFFGCCNVSESYNFDFYYKQNKIKVEDMRKMTVKTEIDYDDTESVDNQDKKLIQMTDESDNDNGMSLKKNKIKIDEENNLLTNLDINSSPVKFKAISECIDENINEANVSTNKVNKVEIYEERKKSIQ